MKKVLLLLFIGFLSSTQAQGVKISSQGQGAPHPSANLELQDTLRGFLPPRLTTAQRNAIQNPAEGLQIYNTDNHCMEFYRGQTLGWYSPCPQPAQLLTDSVDLLWALGFRAHYQLVNDGGNILVQKGLCWDTLSQPDTSDSKIIDLPTLGSSSVLATSLLPGRTYYLRSYAWAQNGPVFYGNTLTIQTPTIKAGANQSLPATQFAASTTLDPQRPPSKAFDGTLDDINGCWHSAQGDIPSAWIRVQFASPQIVNSYAIWRRWGNDHIPTQWVLEASNNGSNWTILDTRSNTPPPNVSFGQTLQVSPFGLYPFNNTTPYTFYRLRSSATNTNALYTVIGELLFMQQ